MVTKSVVEQNVFIGITITDDTLVIKRNEYLIFDDAIKLELSQVLMFLLVIVNGSNPSTGSSFNMGVNGGQGYNCNRL